RRSSGPRRTTPLLHLLRVPVNTGTRFLLLLDGKAAIVGDPPRALEQRARPAAAQPARGAGVAGEPHAAGGGEQAGAHRLRRVAAVAGIARRAVGADLDQHLPGGVAPGFRAPVAVLYRVAGARRPARREIARRLRAVELGRPAEPPVAFDAHL